MAEIEQTSDTSLDVGDIAAYALNRLPPLYATTEEGANYQRQRAREELQNLIQEQVAEAISRYLDRPEFFPERQAITGKNDSNMAGQLRSLLKDYAPNYEK